VKINLLHEKIVILISILILLFFFNLSINSLTYIFDGGHHGSILLEALDLLNGKIPYKEIFLQYGYLNALINTLFLTIFKNDILGIYFSTSLFYLSSIFILGLISKKLYNIKALIFTVIIFIFNQPIPQYPWPNYSAFFFLTLSIFLFNTNNNNKLFLSSFFLTLACLCRENFYYFVLPSFIFINFFIYYNLKDKIKILYFLSGFLIPIIIFFIYLYINNIFFNWLEFQKLPFIYLNHHYEVSFYNLLFDFIFFFLTDVLFSLAISPQYFPILIILLFNFYVLIEEIFFKKNKNIQVIFICLLCLSSIVVSINLEFFRLYTSVIIGLPIFFYKLKSFKLENKFLSLFFILFISFFSIYYFPKGNIKIFNQIDSSNTVKKNDISFFQNQKWEQSKWNFLNDFQIVDSDIFTKCNVNFVLNLTPNAFVLSLSKFQRIQLVPVFNEHLGRDFPIKFQSNLKDLIQNLIINNNIYILSMENNINEIGLKLQNYKLSHKIKYIDHQKSQIRVYVPNSCYNNLVTN